MEGNQVLAIGGLVLVLLVAIVFGLWLGGSALM